MCECFESVVDVYDIDVVHFVITTVLRTLSCEDDDDDYDDEDGVGNRWRGDVCGCAPTIHSNH